jgi:spermidine synthase
VIRRSPLLIALFFASGASALAYEVIWIRILSLTLSITVYALSTVLAAFMAGLAIGAAISARIADRVERPLVAFGLVELGIAACGVALPPMLFNLSTVYVGLHDAFAGTPLVFPALRFLLAFLLLVVPSTLMGLTLPLLSRVVIEREQAVGRGAGGLYGANTIGAVVGCIGAGFAAIPLLGLGSSSALAAALNAGIGLLALWSGWRLRLPVDASARSPQLGATPPWSPAAKLAVGAFAVSGFTAMGYEVLWTRALEHYTHNSTYAYTAMLATFLLGLGAGSAAMARVADRVRQPLFVLGSLQLAIGASVVASLILYRQYEHLVPALLAWMGGLTSWPRAIALIFAEAGFAMLGTTLLLGAMFPLVARIAVESLSGLGRRIGIAYFANTLGSILGSLSVGFLLLPAVGVRNAFLLLLTANLVVGAILATRGSAPLRGAGVAVSGVLVLVCALILIPPRLFEEQFRSRFGNLPFYREEITDTIMVTEDADGERLIRYSDGRGTAGTSTVVGDRMYGHLPLLLHPEPRKVLQIAFGVGNSLGAVLTHAVERVDCVELSPGVIDAAPYFAATNRNALEDPRVRLFINDGRNFLLTSHDCYDVIRLDPPELHTAGVVNLYTREFYELARGRLCEGGIFSIWINSWMTPEEDMQALLRTMIDVFPHVSVWHDPGLYSWIFNGSLSPHDPDVGTLADRFAEPEVSEDLATIGIPGPLHFLHHFVFTGEALRRYAGEGPLVVDDHTRIDFSVPRSASSSFGIANRNTESWLVDLMEVGGRHRPEHERFLSKVATLVRHKQPVTPHLAGLEILGLPPEELQRRIDAAEPTRRY